MSTAGMRLVVMGTFLGKREGLPHTKMRPRDLDPQVGVSCVDLLPSLYTLANVEKVSIHLVCPWRHNA
jgi:hypothetical protein